MTTYKKITLDGDKVQVDSAIRDGNGARIDTTYVTQGSTHHRYASNTYTLGTSANTLAVPYETGGFWDRWTHAISNGFVFSWTLRTVGATEFYFPIGITRDSGSQTLTLRFAETVPAGDYLLEFESFRLDEAGL